MRPRREAGPISLAPSCKVVDLAPLVIPHGELSSSKLPGQAVNFMFCVYVCVCVSEEEVYEDAIRLGLREARMPAECTRMVVGLHQK